MTLKPGSVVLVRFPFSDIASSKQRPALLLKVVGQRKPLQLAVVAMITSRIEGAELEGDLLLRDWKEEGLLHPSKLRLGKIASLDMSLIHKSIGSLSRQDMGGVKSVFRKLFEAWT